MASMDAEAEMENLFAEDEAEEEQPGTQSLTQEEGRHGQRHVASVKLLGHLGIRRILRPHQPPRT